MKKHLLYDALHRTMKMFIALLFTCLLAVGSAWAESVTYTVTFPTTGWSTSGGSQNLNNVTWTYAATGYIGATSDRLQVGSKNDPQTTDWTISTPISSFGANAIITSVKLSAYTTAATATFDISVGGDSKQSGDLTTSSSSYTASNLNATSGDIVITLTGSSTSKAMYITGIEVTYSIGLSNPCTVTFHEGDNSTSITENSVNSGVTVPNASVSCEDVPFVGWTDNTNNITAENLIAAGSSFFPTANTDLYAVFGTLNGQFNDETKTTAFNSPANDWTVSAADNSTSYWKIFKENFILSPEIDLSTISSIDIQMGTFGTLDASEKNLEIYTNNELWLTETATNNNESTSYTITPATSLQGTGQLSFRSSSTKTNAGLRVKSITIHYGTPAYTYTTTVPSCNTFAFHKTVTPENAGSISCYLDGNDVESAEAGDNVYISATPASGYALTNLTIKDADNNVLTYNSNMGLVMPESDVYITATFAKLYNVTCSSVTGAYNFYATPTSAYAGQVVTITASPAEGYTRNGNPTLELDENYTGEAPTVFASQFNNNDFSFIMPESNVMVNVVFSQAPTDPRTIYFNFGDGNEPTPLTETTPGAGITLPDAQQICPAAATNGYTFKGWSTTQLTEETSTQPDNLMAGGSAFTPTTEDVTLYAVYSKGSTSTTTVTDVITADELAATSTTYTDFNNVSINSEAVYAGNNAKNANGAIQMRITNSNSGIVSTVSGGTLASVTINVASNNSNTIDIYGNNTAYTSAANLYATANANQGALIGSTTTSTTITPDNDYQYVGIRSHNGAIYLSSIELKWNVENTTAVYTSTIDCTPTVKTPVISLASGEYNYDKTVTITCATEGATIRYTLDGTEPTENATEYTQALTINESATLVAKAFKDGYYPSEQATATYIMPVYLENIAAFKAAVATDPSTTIRYRIAGNVVVTAINGGQTFVQDNSGQLQSNGLMLYKSGGLNLQIGNVVNNVIGYYNTYSGAMELAVEVNPLMTEETGTPTAVVVSISDFLQNPDLYLYNLIKVEDIHFGATNTYVAGTAGNATALSETEDLDIYNNFKGLDMTLTEGGRADVTGIAMVYVQNNAQNLRLQPRFNNDITLKTVYHDTVAVAACETYNWSSNDQGDDQNYTTSGYKSNTIVGETNDDVYTINLTINHATTKELTEAACDAYTWTTGNGNTYTESGDYTFTTTNANGCDSVVTLHLTIYESPIFDITATPQPVQNTFCTGEEITLGLDGTITASETLLEENFSSCTTGESVEINGLSTFPTVSKVYHMNSGDIKFGSNSGIGSLTSQSLDLSSPFTVTFTAKQYDADENGPVNVTVGGITKSVPALTEEFANYTLEFDAATATSTITIATTNSAKRAYINNIKVETTGSNVVWSTQETSETITVVLTEVGTTTYSATVTNSHNCTTTHDVTFNVLPRPVVDLQNNEKDTLCPGESITLTSANSNDTIFSYQWYKNDVAIEGATARTLTLSNLEGANSGIYKVLTSNIACSEMSNTYELLVNGPGAPDYNFTIAASADIYDTIHIGYCDVNHVFVEPTATHYLEGTRFAEITFANNAATTYDTPGDYLITWTATDGCGNIATCTQTLHIAIEACPNAIDYDGNEYTSVRINCECWTTRDLVSEHYSDGTAIENVMSYSSDIYPNETENVNTYGHLYNWNSTVAEGTALNTPNERGHIQGICPEGWYLPTADQVNGLVNGTMTMNNHRASGYWLDGGGNNSSALTLLPCGQYNEQNGRYENLTGNFYMWNAYEYTNETAKTFEADCHCYLFKVYNSTKGMGYGVRCIMERTR